MAVPVSCHVLVWFFVVFIERAYAAWISVNITSSQAQYDLISATWVSQTECVIVGSSQYNSCILRSIDGGMTWATVFTVSNYQLDDVSSYSQPSTGTNYYLTVGNSVAASSPRIYVSSTGTSWSPISFTSASSIYAVTISPYSGQAYAVGMDNNHIPVVYTASVGNQFSSSAWSTTTAPVSQTVIFNAIQSLTGSDIVMVGNLGYIAQSSDGGNSWNANTWTSSSLYGLSMATTLVGIAVGDAASCFKTTDGGITWTSLTSNIVSAFPQSSIASSSFRFHTVSMTSKAEVFLTGTSGIIIRSYDGGNTWVHDLGYRTAVGIPLYSLAMHDRMIGIAGPASGYVSEIFVRLADPIPAPTSQPSTIPSSMPTRRPSTQPTVFPTRQPTRRPTRQPTRQPTRRPSAQPSSQPTKQPIPHPSSHPTGQPSRQPTRRPTRQPTSHPTRRPSRRPSGHPSSQPTRQPVDRPTSQPSGSPTTSFPTSSPTGFVQYGIWRPSSVGAQYIGHVFNAGTSLMNSFVMVGSFSRTDGLIAITHNNGTTWQTKAFLVSTQSLAFTSVTSARIAGDSYFVAVSISGENFWSQGNTSVWKSGTWIGQTTFGVALGSNGNLFAVGVSNSVSLASSYSSFSSWTSLTTANATITNYAVATNDGKIVVVVGNYGNILASSNAGSSWVAVDSGTEATFYDVAMLKSATVVAVGTGVILKSTNGGSSWVSLSENMQIAQNTQLNAVSVLSDVTYFVGAANGYVYYTRNGGISWFVDAVLSSTPISALTMSSTSVGIAGDSKGNLYYKHEAPAPTHAPTYPWPTGQPTYQPTGPTSLPSSRPTKEPTEQPTSRPTKSPSSHPTGQPTWKPSSPTSRPTRYPTRPSGRPSTQPSSQPNSKPSRRPSRQPTSRPSGQPTLRPHHPPSKSPSSRPTSQPSSRPTRRPSRQPSSQPTRRPTMQPSFFPTSQPVGHPSWQPVSRPTSIPTQQPYKRPSSSPTSKPTEPTGQPTNNPTSPTGQPSTEPTTRPSDAPTHAPSSYLQISVSFKVFQDLYNISSVEFNSSVALAFRACVAGSVKPNLDPLVNVHVIALVRSAAPTMVPTLSPTVSQMPTINPTLAPTKGPGATNQTTLIIHRYLRERQPLTDTFGQSTGRRLVDDGSGTIPTITVAYNVTFAIEMFRLSNPQAALNTAIAALTNSVSSGQFDSLLHQLAVTMPGASVLEYVTTSPTLRITAHEISTTRSHAPTHEPTLAPTQSTSEWLLNVTEKNLVIIVSVLGSFTVCFCLVFITFCVRRNCFRRERVIGKRVIPPPSISIIDYYRSKHGHNKESRPQKKKDKKGGKRKSKSGDDSDADSDDLPGIKGRDTTNDATKKPFSLALWGTKGTKKATAEEEELTGKGDKKKHKGKSKSVLDDSDDDIPTAVVIDSAGKNKKSALSLWGGKGGNKTPVKKIDFGDDDSDEDDVEKGGKHKHKHKHKGNETAGGEGKPATGGFFSRFKMGSTATKATTTDESKASKHEHKKKKSKDTKAQKKHHHDDDDDDDSEDGIRSGEEAHQSKDKSKAQGKAGGMGMFSWTKSQPAKPVKTEVDETTSKSKAAKKDKKKSKKK